MSNDMDKAARFVEAESEEWNQIWSKLATLPINVGLDIPTQALNEGEAWQYMGTWDGLHEFRHRCHPVTYDREYASFRNEDI